MKKTLKILIILQLLNYSFGQVLHATTPPENNMKLIPKGEFEYNSTKVKVNAFWMSEEITNKEYREFIEALKSNPRDSLRVIHLDEMAKEADFQGAVTFYSFRRILDKVTYFNDWGGEHSIENYFYSGKYDDYPVVGVSFESAGFFCIWKTHQLNKQRKEQGLPLLSDFRLPTEIEWVYAAKGNTEGNDPVNVSEIKRVQSGEKGKYGLHNLNANVSEWTVNQTIDGRRVVKGSSWKREADIYERIEKPADYKDNSIGFRIVMSYLRE